MKYQGQEVKILNLFLLFLIYKEIMNESNNSMILKNSRKNNHNTKSNLAKLLTQIELSQSESADLDINIFTFIDELAISKHFSTC